MSRRKLKHSREIIPDPLYGSVLLSRFVNKLMQCGRKSKAQCAVYKAFDIIREKGVSDPLEHFSRALENILCNTELRSRRVGGVTYQVPVPVPASRAMLLALSRLCSGIARQGARLLQDRIADEIMQTVEGKGISCKIRQELQRVVDSNRAFSHYRW